MEKSRILNKYLKCLSREKYLVYKKMKNKCNALIRKTKQKRFKNISKDTNAISKTFWNSIRSFITNKGTIVNDKNIITAEVDEDVMVKGTNKNILIKTNDLVKHEHVNIVANSSGKAPYCLVYPLNTDLDQRNVLETIKRYANHPSIVKIKNSFPYIGLFVFPEAHTHTEDINAIIKSLNPNKSTGRDLILPKIIKAVTNIDTHFTSIRNKNLKSIKHSESAIR